MFFFFTKLCPYLILSMFMQRYKGNYSVGFYKTRNKRVGYQLGNFSNAHIPAYWLGFGGLVRLKNRQVKNWKKGSEVGYSRVLF